MAINQNTTPEPYPGAPAAPLTDDELTDADLDAVSGGITSRAD